MAWSMLPESCQAWVSPIAGIHQVLLQMDTYCTYPYCIHTHSSSSFILPWVNIHFRISTHICVIKALGTENTNTPGKIRQSLIDESQHESHRQLESGFRLVSDLLLPIRRARRANAGKTAVALHVVPKIRTAPPKPDRFEEVKLHAI